MTAKYTDVFTNASLGWPGELCPEHAERRAFAAAGGHWSAAARRRHGQPDPDRRVFDGNAAGPGTDDPQLRDRYGVNFRVNDPPLLLSEAQFQWNCKKGDPGLDGKFKLGGWRHLGSFDDERFERTVFRWPIPRASGCLPSSPATTGSMGCSSRRSFASAQRRRSRDRRFRPRLLRPPDRNLIDLYADAGIEFIGLADERPKDKFGIAVAYAHVSPRAQALDRDFQSFNGPTWPVADLREAVHRGLSVRGAGRPHAAAQRSVHPPSRRRRDQSDSGPCRACR